MRENSTVQGSRRLPEEVRFWARVDQTGDCWLWKGPRQEHGYGRFIADASNNPTAAHRFAWRLINGPIPTGLSVCHHCDNPSCVRPDYLFLGTQIENMRDMCAKDRSGKRLTIAGIRDIRVRVARGERQSTVAELFGVSRPTIADIVHGRTWQHVE